MIEFEKINLEELKNIVYLSYENDVDLWDKYHSVNKLEPNNRHNLEKCVDTTYKRIKQGSEEIDFEYYKVLYNNELIGYIVTFEDILYSFAIAVKYRVKSILKEWWAKIADFLGKEFLTFIYDNNKRCLDFMLKNNMEIIDEYQGIITLKYT